MSNFSRRPMTPLAMRAATPPIVPNDHVKRVILAALVMLLSLPTSLAARPVQSPPQDSIIRITLESLAPALRPTVVFGLPKDSSHSNLLYAAQFVRTFQASNLSEVIKGIEEHSIAVPDTLPDWAPVLLGRLSPMIRLRNFGGLSSPVRAPSYMPGGELQFGIVRGRFDGAGGHLSIFGGSVALVHHSNGQDGCLFVGWERPPDPNYPSGRDEDICIPPTTYDTTTIDTDELEGSFSTNYLDYLIFFRHLTSTTNQRRSVSVGVGLENHLTSFPCCGPLTGLERDIYGPFRPYLSLGVSTRRDGVIGGVDLSLRYMWIPRRPPFDNRVALSWDVVLPITVHRLRWGFLVRYHQGPDYYNADFVKSISELMIGLTFSPGDIGR